MLARALARANRLKPELVVTHQETVSVFEGHPFIVEVGRHKALPFCRASTVLLSKAVPFCAVQQQQVGVSLNSANQKKPGLPPPLPPPVSAAAAAAAAAVLSLMHTPPNPNEHDGPEPEP
eukprot:SAG22_NODE_1818_length_3514_cov_10.657980_6_plen_119_part_01